MIRPPIGPPARTERNYRITYGTSDADAVTVYVDDRTCAERVRALRDAGYLVVVQERVVHVGEWRTKAM